MFTLVDTTVFEQRRLTAKRYRHDCGLEVLSLEAADSENLFSLIFDTVPTDNTGVAHITEHSVLEGSERFPVKDPFVCMLKTSVATFINAMTYPDRTIYPCTTCNRKDYFNLFEVYWDAVFHPRLTPETFAQEGWHYEIHGTARKPELRVNGIVLNEMSGYYSDPTTILGRTIEGALYSKSPMKFDAGGAPAAIPQLTYRKFVNFHKTHYAPAVTKIVLYGDIPTEEKLAFIEEHLQQDLARAGIASSAPSRPAMAPLPRLAKPRVVRARYTPENSQDRGDRGIFALAWALDDMRSPELDLGFQLLEAVLLGNAGSPLGKALLESRLGKEPLDSGYDNETRYTSFDVAMRGVRLKDFKKLEEVIMSTLRQIVKDGLDPAQVQAAVAGFQFTNLNISGKYVIDILEDVCASWVYSDDPFGFLRLSEELATIQKRIAAQPRYFEELIQKWLIDNPARVRVELIPDSSLKAREAAALKARLAKRLNSWTPARIERARSFAQKLQTIALRPDTPEALATLPVLTRDDLPKELKPMPTSDGRFANALAVRRGDVFANGISRLNLLGDLSEMPVELLPWLNFFLLLFRQVGNAASSYDRFSAECAAKGISFSLLTMDTSSPRAPGAPQLLLSLSIEGLESAFADGLELFKRHLDSIIFTERKRIVECLHASASAAAASLATRNNLSRAIARASAGILPFGNLAELSKGFQGFKRLQTLAALNENQLDDFCARMQQIAAWLRTIPLVSAGFVGSDDALARAEQFAGNFPVKAAPGAIPAAAFFKNGDALAPVAGRREFYRLPSKVTSCARLFQAPHISSPDASALRVLSNLLSVGYLWNEVRAKGGAYAVGFGYSPYCRSVRVVSGDDPNPENTFRVFKELPNFIEKHEFAEDEISKAVLTCAGDFFRPDRPAELVSSCALNCVHNRNESVRQREFDALMSVTAADVKTAALRLFNTAPWNDCAIGPNAVSDFTAINL